MSSRNKAQALLKRIRKRRRRMLRAGVQDDRHLAPKSQCIGFPICLKLDSHPPANTPYPQRQGNNDNDKNANTHEHTQNGTHQSDHASRQDRFLPIHVFQDDRRPDNPCNREKKADRRKDNGENTKSGTVQPSLLLRINLLLLLRLKSPCILSILRIASTIRSEEH